ncbi:hypothetical protein T484DRAFT_1819986 [Baffinella frigidus]|nr:hypothetical protein T484DRAFT_1819986 [Cryptophyta sp. CCMP2293]
MSKVDVPIILAWAWAYLFDKSSAAGLKELTGIFGTCAPLGSARDVERLAVYLAVAIDTMAMGNFPYPSDYLTGGAGQLPAWPVRAACTALLSGSDVRGSEVRRSDVRESEAAFPGTRFGTRSAIADPAVLLDGMRAAAMVFYNASGEAKCLELPDDGDYDGVWNYQYCTELLPQETHFAMNGSLSAIMPARASLSVIMSVSNETYFAMAGSPNDMFWKRSWSDAQDDAHSMKLYGVTLAP